MLNVFPSDVSTKWDSFEQFCVWQLVCAEGPDPQSVIPALTDLNPQGLHGPTFSTVWFGCAVVHTYYTHAAVYTCRNLPYVIITVLIFCGIRRTYRFTFVMWCHLQITLRQCPVQWCFWELNRKPIILIWLCISFSADSLVHSPHAWLKSSLSVL